MERRTVITLVLYFAVFVAIIYAEVLKTASADDWRPGDTRREIAYNVFAAVDMMQTMDIRNHDNIEEAVPFTRAILGRNPEPAQTAAYFVATSALHYGISRALPHGWREGWQAVTIIIEGSVVANNYVVGLRVGW